MPSPNRFVVPNDGVISHLRERPLALIAGALVCGGLLGGLLVYQPGSQSAPARTAETTGSAPKAAAPVAKAEASPANQAEPAAPAKNAAAAVDCDQQTWPHLSRECAERMRRSVRVITTDKLPEPVVNAIEAQPSAGSAPAINPTPPNPPPAASAPPPAAPKVAATPPPVEPKVAATPPPATAAPPPVEPKVTATPSPARAAPPPAEPKAAAAPPEPAPRPAVAAVEPAASAAPTASVTADHAKDGKKSKRKKAKSRDSATEDQSIEAADSSDRPRERERVRSRDRDRGGARIVERWTEREYDVPSEERSTGRRRVTVIDRDDGRSERRERVEHSSERAERRGDFFFGSGGIFPFRF